MSGEWETDVLGRPFQSLTLPLGTEFEEAKPSDFIVVDDDLNVIKGDGIPNPATRFHLWIYKEKPNVRSIVHTHPPATSALSMIGQPLVVAHMDMCMFQDQCAYLPDWPGLPIGDEEGIIISEALGDKKTVLLANHGLLTAGETIEYTIVGSAEANPSENRLSNESPVGKAIMGHKKGEVVEVAAPRGSLKFKIMDIKAA